MAFDPVNYEGQDRLAHIEKYVGQNTAAIAVLNGGSNSVLGWIDPTLSPYNCLGDSVTDDTTGFLQACTDAVAARKPVYLPPNKQFLLTAPIPLVSHLHIYGEPTGNGQLSVNGRPSIKNATTDMFSIAASVKDVNIINVYMSCGGSGFNIFPSVNLSTGPIINYSKIIGCGLENGLHAFGGTRLEGVTIADNYFDGFSGEVIVVVGADCWFDRNFINSAGLTHTLYAVDLQAMTHTWFTRNYITVTPAIGLLIKTCTDMFVSDNIIEAPVASQIDGAAVYINQSSLIKFSGNYLHRAIGTPFAQFTGVVTVYDCQEIDIDGTMIDAPVGNATTYAMFALGQSSTTLSGIRIRGTRRSGVGASVRYITTSGTIGANVVADPLNDVSALTDGATVTPDLTLASTFTLSAGGSRTIAAPFKVFPGQRITIEVLNNTGGAIVTTWNAVYNLTGIGGWTDPATTKRRFVTFECRDNTPTLIAIAKATADY